MSTVVKIITSVVLILGFIAPAIAGNTKNTGAFVDGSPDEMLKDFTVLISKVRGALRYHLKRDHGCLPWVSLAINPHDREAILDFSFTPGMVMKVGDVSAKGLGKFLANVPKESYTLGAIGTCETDSLNKEGQTPNVIALHLERRSGSAITLRFPFEQKSNGRVSYIKKMVSVQNATPLLFVRPGR